MSQSSANVLNLGKSPTSTILKLSWPTIVEQIAFTILNFADTAMVGVLGAQFTAAVGISAPVIWLASGIMAAISVGFSVQVAQKIGADDMVSASKASSQSLSASIVLGAIITLLALSVTNVLPKLLGADEITAPITRDYFFIMSFSFFVNTVLTTISAVLRCAGDTTSPLIGNSIAIVANIILNFLFIFPERTMNLFGNEVYVWGAGLGVKGAALATLLSITIATLIVLVMFFFNRKGLKIHTKDVFVFDKQISTSATQIGVPVALERVTLSLGQVVFMRIISSMGTSAVAAHHLAIQAESMSYMPSFGFAVAATTLVGQSIGADKPKMAKDFGLKAANIGAILMTATGVILFFFGEAIVSLFTPDQEVIKMSGAILKIVAFAQPFEAGATIFAGALRGAGDSRWPFYINLIGVWGFRIVLAAIFVFMFNLGLSSVWVAMLVDLVFRGIVCHRRFIKAIG